MKEPWQFNVQDTISGVTFVWGQGPVKGLEEENSVDKKKRESARRLRKPLDLPLWRRTP